MKIELQNKVIAPSITLLRKIPLSGYRSLGRTRLVKLLEAKITEISEVEQGMIEDYGLRDINDKLVANGNGSYQIDPKKAAEWRTDHGKLMDETAVIEKGTYTNHESDIRDILKHLKLDLTDADGDAYLALCDALKVKFEDDKPEKEGK
ncbi:DUF1617 family protein [Loigolactobacillus backii]|uniref:DUF1617 family protein n=1 Tax=Loigolactobacillus backii TaxID=375175 RepID=UPI0022FD4A33|nr:DUF1617 family protein [Loigolactobacillus backii]MDA5386948.1 DUF1617 family protein [Loigolactobacillus backii]MDA5389486.1 DUF1617 family protein [Loigolactobacillus backii]